MDTAWDSVSGTRCTRCATDSNFAAPYTLPFNRAMTPVSARATRFFPEHLDAPACRSAYLLYMRNQISSKIAASSPPCGRTSRTRCDSSFGVLGHKQKVQKPAPRFRPGGGAIIRIVLAISAPSGSLSLSRLRAQRRIGLPFCQPRTFNGRARLAIFLGIMARKRV